MFNHKVKGFTSGQCKLYLERIGFAFDGKINKENLDKIIDCHQKTVPFENLAINPGYGKICLDKEGVFKKIVTDHRGGFCFELNGALQYLLLGLGYDAISCGCRLARGTVFPDRATLEHRAVIVRLDGKRYFCDVGFGGVKANFAVEFSKEKQCNPMYQKDLTMQNQFNSVQNDPNGKKNKNKGNKTYFWIEQDEEGWMQVCYELENNERGLTALFMPVSLMPYDFEMMSNALINPGDTAFSTDFMGNICTDEGFVELGGGMLTISEGEEKNSRPYEISELPEIYKKYFGIEGLREWAMKNN